MTTAAAMRPPMGHGDNSLHLRPESHVRELEDRRGARTTLSHFDSSSDEDEDDISPADDSLDDDDDRQDDGVQTPTAATSHSHIPLHPIPSMQEAFAESLEEATRADLTPKPKLRDLTAKQRRERLLDQDRSHGPPHRLWRFRPGQRCHELRKLVAQISFGVELLIKGMANSNAQVLSILQGHIDEVDEFLEAAMEDVHEATTDLKQRLDFLKVPLQNMDVFEQMLENRKFRLQIVEGNVKIEHILARTSTAHTQTIRDVSEGLWGVKQFSKYLQDNEHGSWRLNRPDVVDVFEAMKGNTEGWHSAFTALESNSTLLSGLLVQLSSLVGDIDKKAGEVSRRTRFTLEPYSDPDGRSMPRSPDSIPEATPPPSPPTSKPEHPTRIQTTLFDESMGSFLQDPESPGSAGFPAVPARSNQRDTNPRSTKDSDTLRNTMLANHIYTPPESSKIIPELGVVREGHQVEEDSESQSVAESQTTNETESSNATDNDDDDDNLLFILQPRTYTPLPPAPLPSPRVSDAPESRSRTPEPTARAPEPIARLPIPDRGSPNELSIHIEAEEDAPLSPEDEVRETVLTVPTRNPRRGTNSATISTTSTPRSNSTATTQYTTKSLQIQSLQVKPLQVRTIRASNQPPGMQRTSRSSDKEVVLGHKTSLRDRVSASGSVPKAIHVPPVNAREFQRPPVTTNRYQTPVGSPQSQRPPQSSRGPEMQRHPEAVRRHHTQQLDSFTPPTYPSLLPSPASERQHFRPVQASPHSPLQQRPHTAGTVRPSGRLAAPSQMGMSTLSRVMTSNTTTTSGGGGGADSARNTVKKKRSAFGWLKKAFSLDEEERAMFEARKRAMPVNYYQPFYGSADGQSPRYLDGKRIG